MTWGTGLFIIGCLHLALIHIAAHVRTAFLFMAEYHSIGPRCYISSFNRYSGYSYYMGLSEKFVLVNMVAHTFL